MEIHGQKMKFSNDGRRLLEKLEGKKPYLYYCSADRATIGIGCTVDPERYRNAYLSDKAIYELLDERLEIFERAINNCIKVPLTQNQYDALVCFAFNVGINAFLNSTLLKKLNAGLYDEVPNQLRRWNKVGADIKEGLVHRREQEIELWIGF